MNKRGRPKQYYRFYVDGKLIKAARVSTILNYCNKMEDSSGYKNWVESKGGEKKAKKYCLAAANRGSRVHKSIELFYSGDTTKYFEYACALSEDDKKYLNSFSTLLSNFKQVHSELEVHYYKNGKSFGGKLDGTGWLNTNNLYLDRHFTKKVYIENPFFLIDYKTKEKQPKHEVYVLKHCLQLGSYALALEQCYGIVVEHIAIFSASPRQLNIYYADKNKLDIYKKEFLGCLDAFIKKQPYDWKALEKRMGAEWNDDWNRMDKAKDHKLPIRLYIKPELTEF